MDADPTAAITPGGQSPSAESPARPAVAGRIPLLRVSSALRYRAYASVAVTVAGDLAGAVAVRLRHGRRGGTEAIDHAVVHRECCGDEHGELDVSVRRARVVSIGDVGVRQGEGIATDRPRDMQERGHLRPKAVG